MLAALLLLSSAIAGAHAHQVAWAKGMYCKNGLSHEDQPNAAFAMEPLWHETYSQWFMHGQCRNFPPPAGEFLELPAGGSFTAEISPNRAFTSLSYNGTKATGWGDGKHHLDNYSAAHPGGFSIDSLGCISSPNLHTKSQADAAGTVFAIAYKSNMSDVTMDDLVVFTVAPNTPFKVKASYDVPADMPACPPGGCICAWGWVPNHCGLANVYMNGYRCKVTGARADAPKLAKPQAPVWCEDDETKCVKGAKKMVIYYQTNGNTIDLSHVKGTQKDGQLPSPGYNMKMGFRPGAQNDIFVTGSVAAQSVPPPPASKPVAAPASSKPAAKPATTQPATKPATTKPAAEPATTKPAPMGAVNTAPKPKAATNKTKPKPKPATNKPKPASGKKTCGKGKTCKGHKHKHHHARNAQRFAH